MYRGWGKNQPVAVSECCDAHREFFSQVSRLVGKIETVSSDRVDEGEAENIFRGANVPALRAPRGTGQTMPGATAFFFFALPPI